VFFIAFFVAPVVGVLFIQYIYQKYCNCGPWRSLHNIIKDAESLCETLANTLRDKSSPEKCLNQEYLKIANLERDLTLHLVQHALNTAGNYLGTKSDRATNHILENRKDTEFRITIIDGTIYIDSD